MNKDKIFFKSVVKAKEMEDEMFIKIEKWARETFEDAKVKYKDEMVISFFLFLGSFKFHKRKIRRAIQRQGFMLACYCRKKFRRVYYISGKNIYLFLYWSNGIFDIRDSKI